MIVAALLLMVAGNLPGGLSQCRQFQHQGKTAETTTCFARLARTGDPFLEAEAAWVAGQFKEASRYFQQAHKMYGSSAEVKTEWGKLFLERFNAAEAKNLFEEALKADPNYVPAYLGLARISAQGYDNHALELVHEALKHDPKSVEAHELLAYLALEDDDQKAATDEAQAALKLSDEALDALAVLASIDYLNHDWTNARAASPSMQRLLQVNPTYAQGFTTAGHFLEIHARYEEAIKLYREALHTDEKAWAARSALGINLMRLAQYTEAKQQLEASFQGGYKNAETANSLRFLDKVPEFEVTKSRDAVLVLHKDEAALLKPFMQPELERAVHVYERKYKMKLPTPVRLEVYPNHDDFIVRTLGLPGQGGLLGVTFGLVVAMDSPSARAPGEFSWDSTLWHELSHVYILTATRHLVPRWFTEGLAVHEEGAASKAWGDRLTPDIVEALAKKRLLRVSELDRGFVRPSYPGQVLVSYYQAGRMCDFIAQRWGDGALLAMVQSYAKRMTTAEAIEANLHVSADTFDKDFGAWLDKETGGVVKNLPSWQKQLPAANKSLETGNLDGAITEAQAARDAYPEYTGSHSAYQTLAAALDKKGDVAQEQTTLEKYRDLGGHDVSTLKKLAEVEQQQKNPAQAVQTLAQLETVYLGDQKEHEMLGRLYLDQHKSPEAVREFQAVVNLKPTDEAQARFDLARALQAAARPGDAKDQVLLALEAAPNFKPAQQLLLQLSQ